MKKTNTQKGITLIALIITIIVLIILAVVTIGAVDGEDGIIAHAEDARDKYNAAKTNEQAILSNYLAKIEENTTKEETDPNKCTCTYGYLDEWTGEGCTCGENGIFEGEALYYHEECGKYYLESLEHIDGPGCHYCMEDSGLKQLIVVSESYGCCAYEEEYPTRTRVKCPKGCTYGRFDN